MSIIAAELLHPRDYPVFKKRRVRGMKADGLRYERAVQKAIKELHPVTQWNGPWFRYTLESVDRKKYCQPDIMLQSGHTIWLIEIKRSCLLAAYDKLSTLYEPVARLAFQSYRHSDGLPISFKTVQIFKYLTRETLAARQVVPLSQLLRSENPPQFGVHFLAI